MGHAASLAGIGWAKVVEQVLLNTGLLPAWKENVQPVNMPLDTPLEGSDGRWALVVLCSFSVGAFFGFAFINESGPTFGCLGSVAAFSSADGRPTLRSGVPSHMLDFFRTGGVQSFSHCMIYDIYRVGVR